MRDKLITLSYIFNGNILKMEKAIKSGIDIKVNQSFLDELRNSGIEVITILDKDYPSQLRNLYNPPLVLYCLGNKSLLNSEMFAIIGSRNNSDYSKNVCNRLVFDIDKRICIVSGLAKGIDSLAHISAIESSKKTIAVLGFGFNNIYPKSNVKLAQEIAKSHLLISEYPPNTISTRSNFPLRNRIIAALSSRIYVIEAKKKSGSLITANIGLELGKDIYCIPCSIFDENFDGSHELINDGAYLYYFRNEELK